MAIYDNSEQEFKIKCKDKLQELIVYINSDTDLRMKYYLGLTEIENLKTSIDEQEKELKTYKTFFHNFKQLMK